MEKDKIWYVYEIINVLGTVEYVGYTSDPRMKKWKHFKNKPKPGCFHGKFYQRQDCFFHIIDQFKTKIDARNLETKLQKELNLDTHGDAISNWQRKNRTKQEKHRIIQKSEKYQNVYYNSKSNHWFSKIEIDGKIKYLGKFPTEEKAANAFL